MGEASERGKFFITAALLPVKLRIASLHTEPGQRIEGVV
jgi:hypothetical protein